MQDDISRIGEFLQKKNKRESIQEATVIAGDCTTIEVSNSAYSHHVVDSIRANKSVPSIRI